MALKATDEGIVIVLERLVEESAIKGNAMASGDDAADAAAEKWVRDQLDAGNEWAWFTAHVCVTYRDAIEADAYLGQCSYDSEAAFKEPDGYYHDMIKECLLELDRKLAILCGPLKRGS
jgi:hypothetical protein